MTKKENDLVNPSLKVGDFFKANFTLAFYKSLMVIPTQPFQVIMRVQQAALASKEKPVVLSVVEATKKIINSPAGSQNKNLSFSPLRPFFNGGMIGMSKELGKGLFYKGALTLGSPELAHKILASIGFPTYVSPLTYHLSHSLLAGTIAGSLDTIIGGGLESWATFRATSQGKDVTASFWKEVGAENSPLAKIGRFYRGSGPSIAKGSIAFSTFFAAASPIKSWVASFYNIQDKNNMPWYANISSALLTGGIVAVTSSPWDIIKTQSQMPNPNKEPILRALISNYTLHGLKGITAGLPLKFLMITLGWGITHLVIQPGNHKHLNHVEKDEPQETSRPKF